MEYGYNCGVQPSPLSSWKLHIHLSLNFHHFYKHCLKHIFSLTILGLAFLLRPHSAKQHAFQDRHGKLGCFPEHQKKYDLQVALETVIAFTAECEVFIDTHTVDALVGLTFVRHHLAAAPIISCHMTQHMYSWLFFKQDITLSSKLLIHLWHNIGKIYILHTKFSKMWITKRNKISILLFIFHQSHKENNLTC